MQGVVQGAGRPNVGMAAATGLHQQRRADVRLLVRRHSVDALVRLDRDGDGEEQQRGETCVGLPGGGWTAIRLDSDWIQTISRLGSDY